ncbi:MAG: divalent-cation tolerance protein CutA [Hyphomicrobiales bacterium]|nr:divalent-cation tolerance protein CutA [Hyphomicrobiales bacterium]
MGVSLVITTVDSEAAAEKIAHAALDAGLAACVQIFPIRSLYVWKGAREDAREWRLEMKMRTTDYGALEAAILAVHPYETPEIVRVDAAGGFAPYLDWVRTAR